MSTQGNTKSLYIHIPFCKSKCIYCDFNSIVTKSKIIDEYLKAVENELRPIGEKHLFKTIYIGGGTPTVLNETQLYKLLKTISNYIDKQTLKEYTIEINPGTINKEKIQIMRDNNINRASIGVQSFNDKHLRTISRTHTSTEAKEAFLQLRENGFNNINIDLIYGLQDQTLPEWEQDLLETTRLTPDHISAYCLTYEQGTPLAGMVERGTVKKQSDENELDMFEYTEKNLCEKGYTHYEISNFAQGGKECRHNIVYWKNEEYIGVGAGAFSYVNGLRYCNIKDVNGYTVSALAKNDLVSFSEKLTGRKRASEILIMALRMASGITRKDFYNKSGFGLMALFGKQINNLAKTGYINYDGKRIKLTEKGLKVADSVMMEFV